MSFNFDWSACEEKRFATKLKGFLTDALKRIVKPSIIIDDIVVKDLVLGDSPPKLEILDIGDVAEDRFRGIFKLNYTGNASITLTTTIEANPLRLYDNDLTSKRIDTDKFATPTFVGASESLPMPLNLSLSEIKLSGIIILVISKAKGLTLVFRNDPLESIKVSSSLDTVPMLANFLQIQIEEIIRTMFREQLPSILHRISKRYTPEGSSSSSVSSSVSTSGDSTPPSNQHVEDPSLFVSFEDDSPDFSLSNILKLETLCASQRTLNLFTPSIPDAVYRSNLEAIDSASKGIVLDKTVNADLAEVIRAYQSKSSRNIKPKRRVIKLNLGKSKSADKSAGKSEEKATAVESVANVKSPSASNNSSDVVDSSINSSKNRSLEQISETPEIAHQDDDEHVPEYLQFSAKYRHPELLPIASRNTGTNMGHNEKEHSMPNYYREPSDSLKMVKNVNKTTTSTPNQPVAKCANHQNMSPKQEFFKNFFLSNTHSDVPPPYVA